VPRRSLWIFGDGNGGKAFLSPPLVARESQENGLANLLREGGGSVVVFLGSGAGGGGGYSFVDTGPDRPSTTPLGSTSICDDNVFIDVWVGSRECDEALLNSKGNC